jgi:hypothetical protein
MTNLADRYTHLSRAYIQLADKFQKLDVDHMELRSKIIPALKALTAYKQIVEDLNQEKQALTAKLLAMTAKYEELKPLEALFSPEIEAILAEAEEQIALVNMTMEEMDRDRDPDLSEAEKQLLQDYQNNPEEFSPITELPMVNLSLHKVLMPLQ